MPPAGQPTNLTDSWAILEEGVSVIMTKLQEGMSYTKYMELYTTVYNYCTSSRMNQPNSDLNAGRSGANLMGADLYKQLNNYLIAHLTDVRTGAVDLIDEPFLHYYTKEWHRYTQGASYINRLFLYLNRHWVKREKDEGRKNVYQVYTLALVTWRDVFFNYAQQADKATKAVLELISRQRTGETIDNSLVKKAVESFVALGLDESDTNRTNLEVYRDNFEKPFLEATEIFYKNESNAFIAENSVTDYMKKAVTRLDEEEDRVQMYLHASTKKGLVLTCENVLVKAHTELLQEEFQKLLDQDKEEDLNRMYNLLSRIPNGLDPLKVRFEDHVKTAGLSAIERACQTDKDVDPKSYVDAILEVHTKNAEVVANAFRGDPGFVASLDKACREFINRNKATKPTPEAKENAARSPELLAKFADSLLKKSNKASEEADLDEALKNTMTIFKYIDDKDVFQKFYQQALSRRLVHATSASDDAEANMISRLKDACGFEYTNKLQRMFQDITLCKDLNDNFKEFLNNVAKDNEGGKSKDSFDFNVQVLGSSSWPLKAPNTELTPPPEMLKTLETFKTFYTKKHSGRKLTWLWQNSRNEICTTYLDKRYILICSTYQATILLQFNNGSDSLTFAELQAVTNIKAEVIKPVLELLVKTKVLSQDGDQYDLNFDFKSKKIRVPINMPIKSEVKAEANDVLKTVEEDRKLLMQAVIVRIMKSRKEMKHQPLIQETITQLAARFTPKVSDIKKAIDTLLDKEYMERVEGSRDQYRYVA